MKDVNWPRVLTDAERVDLKAIEAWAEREIALALTGTTLTIGGSPGFAGAEVHARVWATVRAPR